jgi:Zn-dependent protease
MIFDVHTLLGKRLTLALPFGLPAVAIDWSWVLGACVWMWVARGSYRYASWLVAECGGILFLTLAHEFGHAIAMRCMGMRIVELNLTLLGGSVQVPNLRSRGQMATLVAAGTAANVLLVPPTYLLGYGLVSWGAGDFGLLVWRVACINVVLIGANLLPLWPLDGGQLVTTVTQSYVGYLYARLSMGLWGIALCSLGIAWLAHLGLYVAALFPIVLLWSNTCLLEWAVGLVMARRRRGVNQAALCPNCRSAALEGPTGTCEECGMENNPFASGGRCWHCGARDSSVTCSYCGETSDVKDWTTLTNELGRPE